MAELKDIEALSHQLAANTAIADMLISLREGQAIEVATLRTLVDENTALLRHLQERTARLQAMKEGESDGD